MLPPPFARKLKEAIALHQRGDAPQAERIYREVIAADADAADAWHMLAIAQADQGRFGEAAQAARSATELRPAIPQYWLTRGKIAAELHEESEAQASLRRAAELEPRFAEPWFDLGRSYEREQRLGDAAAAYRAALERNPGPAEIHYRLASVLLWSSQPQAALEAFQRAFERDPGFKLDRTECLDFIRKLDFQELPAFWQADLLSFFRRADIDRTRHAAAGLSVLMAKPAFRAVRGALASGGALAAAGGALQEVMRDPLFGLLLGEALLANAGYEALLTRLRAELLRDETLRGAAPLDFLANLAGQCFINEFVYAETPEESAAVAALARELEPRLGQRVALDERAARALAVLAMYRPLHRLRNAQALVAMPWPSPALARLVRRSVADVFEEEGLRAAIPSLAPITDAVSQQVRAQYEENPYPRWLSFHRRPPVTCAEWLAPDAPLEEASAAPANPSILVAGCGTGHEALFLAAGIAGSRVTAVDLSLASLAYARRMANALAIANVDFIQADILELDRLGREFDLVYASGVLHHMRDPKAGLAALVRRVRPGALAQVQLYSRSGRAYLNAARELIRARGLQPTPEAIRAFRQEVLRAGRDSPLRGLLASRDFFSTSECRDLLFHVQEHQFDLPEIVGMLQEGGLVVLGLSKQVERSARLAYRELFPEDAAQTDPLRWHAAEQRHAQLFRGMYQVWCRRPAA